MSQLSNVQVESWEECVVEKKGELKWSSAPVQTVVLPSPEFESWEDCVQGTAAPTPSAMQEQDDK